MASTGVVTSDSAISQFTAFKKNSSTLKYMILSIVDGKIEVERESTETNYDEFLSHLPGDACRFAFYKCPYRTRDDRDAEKVTFISW